MPAGVRNHQCRLSGRINTRIIQPLIDHNSRLARSDFPDFNDPNKLGEGKAMVDRLTHLISIFQKPELDFSKNRAEHDDILGDAYEYFMRHFATESGKSKGQFYTPSEVSCVIAKVIGISPRNTVAATTAYDPTCGSGSLLLKVAAEAGRHITLEGQEKDVTTAGLARMNMILHDFPTATILSGNTLASPKFKDGEMLRTYDYVVANPSFSDKTWSTGLTPANDPFQRFTWGEPPAKQGDYAYLLHIVRSMKSHGKAACILPHGVLFRGNAEAAIRRQLAGCPKDKNGGEEGILLGCFFVSCISLIWSALQDSLHLGRLRGVAEVQLLLVRIFSSHEPEKAKLNPTNSHGVVITRRAPAKELPHPVFEAETRPQNHVKFSHHFFFGLRFFHRASAFRAPVDHEVPV